MTATTSKSWICLVCGYVHVGDEPPAECPVCGALADAFELQSPPKEPIASPKSREWRCIACGYIHQGDTPPSECPLCGAPADAFELLEVRAPAGRKNVQRPERILIVGGGIAGVSAAEAAHEESPESEIILITDENHPPYYRLNLSRFLAGQVDENDLFIHPVKWYAEHNIELRLGASVLAIDADKNELTLKEGEKLSFDALVLATGAFPFVPPFKGADLDGVRVFRTIDDAKKLAVAAKEGTTCVCIGGGILGLETAGALARRGVAVTLLENAEWLLPHQLDKTGGVLLERWVNQQGIHIKRSVTVSEIVGDTKAIGVRLDTGEFLGADFVVITAGVRSNAVLAKAAGIATQHGILVDDFLRTTHPRVFAAGDVAEHQGIVYGLWDPARYQGVIAGRNAAGASVQFGGVPRSNTLKVLDIPLFSIGIVNPADNSYREIAAATETTYERFLLQQNKLVGAILMGDVRLAGVVTKIIKSATVLPSSILEKGTCSDFREFLENQR